jgi:methanogenic corrinoid protein MtbC1
VTDKLKEEGVREGLKVFIGGAPTSPEFAEQIGADAHCRDAFQAIDVLKTMAP